MSSHIKYERPLSTSQLDLLVVLYSFRFNTRSLVSAYYKKPNTTSLYFKFEVLRKHGHITKKFEPSYRFAGREAEYYVTPKGLRALRDAKRIEVTDVMITACYRDRTVTDSFVLQQTLLFRIRNHLTSTYGDIQYFTSRDIQLLDYFPSPRPDAFMSLKNHGTVTRFFVEYIPRGTHVRQITHRLKQYTTYFDENTWGVTDTPFPVILYICEDGMTEKGVMRQIRTALYKADTDMQFLTTTQKALLGTSKSNFAVWTGIDDPDLLLTLDNAQ